MFDTLFHVYHSHYRKFLVMTVLLFAASLAFLGVNYAQAGEFASRGVSLKGGITLTVPLEAPVNLDVLDQGLAAALPTSDIEVRGISERGQVRAIIVEASDVDESALVQAVRAQGVPVSEGKYSIEVMGSDLGQNFYRQTLWALVFAFVSMSIVVYLTFRAPLPSAFVILATVSDLVSTLAVVSIVGMKLSTAGIAAFLMMIGYSVDNNILLTVRALKRKEGSLNEGIEEALRTGLLMTATALIAVAVGYFFTDSDVIKQIMFILLIGLLFDLIYTWFQNAAILRLYMEAKVP
ncbi:hypothetical protein HY490_01570 [Candidatus Woesearchaeota archaeon]|nr:hypothetical protein [Candidatus Woesearchaeota archaeon]